MDLPDLESELLGAGEAICDPSATRHRIFGAIKERLICALEDTLTAVILCTLGRLMRSTDDSNQIDRSDWL